MPVPANRNSILGVESIASALPDDRPLTVRTVELLSEPCTVKPFEPGVAPASAEMVSVEVAPPLIGFWPNDACSVEGNPETERLMPVGAPLTVLA